ncbi:transcriptional regulator LldR [Ottowia sp.]|uniref:transcriptional regulator LldR n=1 Tax=Ottowia sp. TaxID=1898956 RepID=UPI003A8BD1E0
MRISDEVAQQLLALMQSRGIQPGQRLPAERQLAEDLGVSRTSLREAMQRLASLGAIVTRRGDGSYVQNTEPDWSQSALKPLANLLTEDAAYRYDVLEARHALESSTAWHAAHRATPGDKAHIRRCFDTLVHHQANADADRAAKADAQFHLAIAEASHNLVLVQVMRSLFDLVLSTVAANRRAMFVASDRPTMHALTSQHEALMQAIDSGDAEQARRVIGQHLDYVHSSVRQGDEDDARRNRASRLVTPYSKV